MLADLVRHIENAAVDSLNKRMAHIYCSMAELEYKANRTSETLITLAKQLNMLGIPSNTVMGTPAAAEGQRGSGHLTRGYWPFRTNINIPLWQCLPYSLSGSLYSGEFWATVPVKPGRYRAYLLTDTKHLIDCRISVDISNTPLGRSTTGSTVYYYRTFRVKMKNYHVTNPATIERLTDPWAHSTDTQHH